MSFQRNLNQAIGAAFALGLSTGFTHPLSASDITVRNSSASMPSAIPIGTESQSGGRRPNLLLIVSDDLGYADLSCTGAPDIRTPHIDSLARNGATFTNAYVTAPVCLPSRMGLITGTYQQRFGIQTLAGPGGPRDYGVPLDRLTIAEHLRPASYATGVIGKWHLGEDTQFLPNQRGFDEFYGFLGGSLPYFPEKPGAIWRNDRKEPKTQYMTDAFGDEAIAFIDRHHNTPFFLYLPFSAVHLPLEATEKHLGDYSHIRDISRRKYAAMTSAMDTNIGRILDTLRHHQILDDTLVFFLSDNGGFPRRWASNKPYRAGKYEIYEGGIRTPFFVQWKNGGVASGTHYDQPVSSLDILPTALSATGIKPGGKHALDGVDLLPLLRGAASTLPRKQLYWRYGPRMCAIREGDWKLIKNGIAAGKTPQWELYNLKNDPGETTDLASGNSEKANELARHFDAWDASLPPPAFIDRRITDGIDWWHVKAQGKDPIQQQD